MWVMCMSKQVGTNNETNKQDTYKVVPDKQAGLQLVSNVYI